jgi:hypothetical protein
MNTEQEIRKNFRENNNGYWQRRLPNGNIECLNKDYYDEDGTRLEDKLLNKIERELNSI